MPTICGCTTPAAIITIEALNFQSNIKSQHEITACKSLGVKNVPTPPSAENLRNNLVPPSQSTGDCKKKSVSTHTSPRLSPIIPIHSPLPTLASSPYRNRRRCERPGKKGGRESLGAGRGQHVRTSHSCVRACVGRNRSDRAARMELCKLP